MRQHQLTLPHSSRMSSMMSAYSSSLPSSSNVTASASFKMGVASPGAPDRLAFAANAAASAGRDCIPPGTSIPSHLPDRSSLQKTNMHGAHPGLLDEASTECTSMCCIFTHSMEKSHERLAAWPTTTAQPSVQLLITGVCGKASFKAIMCPEQASPNAGSRLPQWHAVQ